VPGRLQRYISLGEQVFGTALTKSARSGVRAHALSLAPLAVQAATVAEAGPVKVSVVSVLVAVHSGPLGFADVRLPRSGRSRTGADGGGASS
jgi:hypothetical protein